MCPVLIKLPLWQHPLLSYQQHPLFTISSCFFFFSVFLQFVCLFVFFTQHFGAVFPALCLLLLYLWRESTDYEIHWNFKTNWTEVGKMDQSFRVELWAIQLPGEVNTKELDRKCPIKNNFFKRVKIGEQCLSHIHSLLRHNLGSDKTWRHFPHLSGQTHKTSSLWSKSSTVPPLWKATWHKEENKQTIITISFFCEHPVCISKPWAMF